MHPFFVSCMIKSSHSWKFQVILSHGKLVIPSMIQKMTSFGQIQLQTEKHLHQQTQKQYNIILNENRQLKNSILKLQHQVSDNQRTLEFNNQNITSKNPLTAY